jgi:hypothetical protein
MKTTLKTSALLNVNSATVHLPTPATTFGSGFRQFLASAPIEDEGNDTTRLMTTAFRQPVEFLEAVPTIAATTRPASTSALNVQDSLARCLGAALLLAARPTQQAPALRQAVMALR